MITTPPTSYTGTGADRKVKVVSNAIPLPDVGLGHCEVSVFSNVTDVANNCMGRVSS